jgi:hypothetical protein
LNHSVWVETAAREFVAQGLRFLFAVQIAKRVEAKIVILHAVEPLPPMVVSFGGFSHQVARDRWDETAKKFIAVTSREGTGARFVVRIPPLPSQQDKMD